MAQPREFFVQAVTNLDYDSIEEGRGMVQPSEVPVLTAWYGKLSSWPQKLALVDLICDQHHPSMETVLIDALRAPGEGDVVDLPKAFALGWLSDELSNFSGYYSDRALLRRTVDAYLAERGLTCEAELVAPSPPSNDVPPDLPFAQPARLLAAVKRGLNDEVRTILAQGASPSTCDDSGDPVLLRAIMAENFDAALLLLEAGADANAQRKTGLQSALWWAASAGSVEVLEALLKRGASVDAENQHGSTPLTVACTGGHVDVVRRLIAAGANVRNCISDGRSVINLAVRGGKPEILKLLVEAGADVQSHQPAFTPLAFACFEGNAATVMMLLSLGANPNVAVSGAGFEGITPLMLAARAGESAMVRHLLAAGADAAAKDAQGLTASDMTKGRRADEILKLLRGER